MEIEQNKTVLKQVLCTNWGGLSVIDIKGNRVAELCGEMTLNKYNEVERRSMVGITEFIGLEHYRCVVCELKEEEEKRPAPIASPTPNPPTPNSIDIEIENTTNQKMPVVLFGGNFHHTSLSFGNNPGIVLSANYKSVLVQTMNKPLVVKSISIDDHSKITGGLFVVKNTNAYGTTTNSLINIGNYVTALQLTPTVNVNVNNIVIDGNTEINFELKEKSSLRIRYQ